MKCFESSGIAARIGLVCLISGLAVFSLQAQVDFAVGSIIKGFEMPQRDEEGNVKLKIFGREATVMSLNRIRVRGLKIDIMSNGEAKTHMTSDESDFWRDENRLTTASGVVVDQENFTLSAQNMDWNLKDNKGLFQENVKVVINRESEGLTP